MDGTHTLLPPAGDFAIRPAAPGDLDCVLALLEEAAAWLAARGIDQWRPGSFPRLDLAARIDRGEVYLATAAGAVAGTLTLQWTDPFDRWLWGEGLELAGYVHRLAVARRFAGQGASRALLQWAEQCVAAAGKPYLRLDCMAENAALRAYYARAGFTYRGEVQGAGWRAALYEKAVGGGSGAILLK